MAGSDQLIRPISGFIPTPGHGLRMMGPPNTSLTKEEKRRAARDPLSFRNTLTKKANSSYEEARQWIVDRTREGVIEEVEQVVIVYRQTDRGTTAWGIIADVSLEAYADGLIKRHEATIPESEERMIEYMDRTRVFGNPVALTHRPESGVIGLLETCQDRSPDVPLKASDGSNHDLWLVSGSSAAQWCNEFEGPLYITDGHHRLAAAASLGEGADAPRYLPAAIFDTSQLHLKSFARCITNIPMTPDELMKAIASDHVVTHVDSTTFEPISSGNVGARIGSDYVQIEIARELIPDDLYASLDANLLQDLILGPLIGVDDPRNDDRVDFIESDREFDLPRYQAWFLPHPEAVTSVLGVADRGLIMPPKSTLFWPKPPAGIVMRYVNP